MINFNEISAMSKNFDLISNERTLKEKSNEFFSHFLSSCKTTKDSCLSIAYFFHHLEVEKRSSFIYYISMSNDFNINNKIISENQTLLTSTSFKKQKEAVTNIVNSFCSIKKDNVLLFSYIIYMTPEENQPSVLRFFESISDKYEIV